MRHAENHPNFTHTRHFADQKLIHLSRKYSPGLTKLDRNRLLYTRGKNAGFA